MENYVNMSLRAMNMAHYGPDFMCPNPNFDSTKDAPNIIKIPLEKKKGVCYYGKE